MAYDRYSRDANRGDRDFDYGRDYGSARGATNTYSSARDYEAGSRVYDDRNDSRNDSRRGYGARIMATRAMAAGL